MLDRHDASFEKLLEEADKALYRAKAEGRNLTEGPAFRPIPGNGRDACVP